MPSYAINPKDKMDDWELTKMWCMGATVKEIASHFQRKPSAISSRLKKLELVEKYGDRTPLPSPTEKPLNSTERGQVYGS